MAESTEEKARRHKIFRRPFDVVVGRQAVAQRQSLIKQTAAEIAAERQTKEVAAAKEAGAKDAGRK